MKLHHSIPSLLLLLSTSFALQAATITTSFEFNNTSGFFTLTDNDASATFSGGEAKSVGIFSLYHSGANAWMIAPGATGNIDFNPPAQELTVFFRTQSGNNSSTLELLDSDGQILGSFPGTSASWAEINASVATLGKPVAKITLRNQSANGYAVLDDLSVIAAESSTGQRFDNPIPASIQRGSVRLRLKQIANELTAPNWAISAPGDSKHLYVGDQNGKLWRIALTDGDKEVFWISQTCWCLWALLEVAHLTSAAFSVLPFIRNMPVTACCIPIRRNRRESPAIFPPSRRIPARITAV